MAKLTLNWAVVYIPENLVGAFPARLSKSFMSIALMGEFLIRSCWILLHRVPFEIFRQAILFRRNRISGAFR